MCNIHSKCHNFKPNFLYEEYLDNFTKSKVFNVNLAPDVENPINDLSVLWDVYFEYVWYVYLFLLHEIVLAYELISASIALIKEIRKQLWRKLRIVNALFNIINEKHCLMSITNLQNILNTDTLDHFNTDARKNNRFFILKQTELFFVILDCIKKRHAVKLIIRRKWHFFFKLQMQNFPL